MPDGNLLTGASRGLKITLLVTGLLTGWFYFWCAKQPGIPFIGPTASGYYGPQAVGFLQGHLYAAIEPHPALKALPDPYDPVANAPYRVHDMTYYRGKYYLYFGVVPVIILFLPWAALTGSHLTEPFAVAFFCFAGFLAGAGLLVALRRRYFPSVSPAWVAAVLLTWALGNYVIILMQGPGFYQVPIACAFMLLMFGLVAIYRSVHADTAARATRGLVWAGVCAGLCLGCRPNYLPIGCCLVIPAAWLAWHWGGNWRAIFSGAGVKFAAAALLPVGLIGVGLLGYNYARFGNPLEFGIHYQLAGERVSDIQLLSPKFILRNMPEYLFNGGIHTPYFPYLVSTPLSPLGAVRYFPVAWVGLITLGVFLSRRWHGGAAWALTVAAMGVGNLLMLSLFFGKTDRYPPDFTPCFVLLGLAGVLAAVHQWPQVRGRLVLRAGLGGLMLVSALAGLAIVMNFSPARTRQIAQWETWLNYPSYWWMQATGHMPGVVKMEITPVRRGAGEADPLVESGTHTDRRDALTLEHLEDGRVRFRFFHAGLGGPTSEPITLDYGRSYPLEVVYGGLLPPPHHPYFAGWSEREIFAARNRVLVRFDGAVVLDAAMASYDSRPEDVHLGWSAYASGALAATFPGRLVVQSVDRLKRADFAAAPLPENQPLKLTLRFPLDRTGAAEPLLATGRRGLGDLIYVQYTAPGKLRFGIDHYGAGGPLSHEVTYDPAVPQQVLVWMGSWMTQPPAGADPNEIAPDKRIFIAFNKEVLLDSAHPFSPDTPRETSVGINAISSTAAEGMFSGRVLEVTGAPYASLPVTASTNGYGAVVMSVQFPAARAGASEPLVTTGVTGAGDILYVRYVDNDHAIFGFDHWGVGGVVSPPVKIEYGRTYRLEMTIGSLYAPADFASGKLPAELKELVRVKLDNTIVLDGHSACHPTRGSEIRIGVNRIGGSTAGWEFFGKVLGLERPERPTFPVGGK